MVNNNSNIEHINFTKAISQRYLSYALSTITSRSLPDVRDGLKPVHRRILYAMLKLKLDPKSGYKKCARVVGDVMGKYHPHSDIAIYDTLVRLAQTFSLRYPLIDGQGNFGSLDGDNAAAMRYTESRMTEICILLMSELDKDTVDFRPTYDDSDEEPALLPAEFPNLLANGSEGIAVGMATNIPPHNLSELCSSLIYLIDNRETATISEILKFIKGPDFPTGGVIIDSPEMIKNAYNAGKGSFRVRAKWHKESLSHGLFQIVITEIPYQVQKSKLIEQIADLLKDKKLPLIGNIRDESAEDIQIIIEPRGRNCSEEMIMESLFKQTILESRIYLNMNVLSSDGVPKVMNIMQVLEAFLDHREIIITRRTKYRIAQIDDRLEILSALKIAYLNIDEVIRIIREEDNPKQEMIIKFHINENQAEAILNIKLRSLRRLEEEQINKEYEALTKEHKSLTKILTSKSKLWDIVKQELEVIRKKFDITTALGKRRTEFMLVKDQAQVTDISAFIEKEAITVICSKMGWIRSIKGHNLDLTNIKYKEGDTAKFIIETYTTENILICSSRGRFFTILADNIFKGKGHGESVKLMVEIGNYDIINILPYRSEEKLLLASDLGKGFIVDSNQLVAQTKGGKQVMNITDKGKCIVCLKVIGDMVACIGSNRKLLVFKIAEILELKRGSGVILQKFRDANLNDVKIFDSKQGLSWNLGNKTRVEKSIMLWQSKRGGVGKIPPSGFPKNNRFS